MEREKGGREGESETEIDSGTYVEVRSQRWGVQALSPVWLAGNSPDSASFPTKGIPRSYAKTTTSGFLM